MDPGWARPPALLGRVSRTRRSRSDWATLTSPWRRRVRRRAVLARAVPAGRPSASPPRRRAPIQTHANGGVGSSPPAATPLVSPRLRWRCPCDRAPGARRCLRLPPLAAPPLVPPALALPGAAVVAAASPPTAAPISLIQLPPPPSPSPPAPPSSSAPPAATSSSRYRQILSFNKTSVELYAGVPRLPNRGPARHTVTRHGQADGVHTVRAGTCPEVG